LSDLSPGCSNAQVGAVVAAGTGRAGRERKVAAFSPYVRTGPPSERPGRAPPVRPGDPRPARPDDSATGGPVEPPPRGVRN